MDAGTPGLASLRAASRGQGWPRDRRPSPRGPGGCPTPCMGALGPDECGQSRGRGASHTGRFWGVVGPALTREAEEREEGEEACPGGLVREGPGYPPRLRGCGMWGKGWDTHSSGGTSVPVCWGNWGHWAKWGSPPLPAQGGVCPSCMHSGRPVGAVPHVGPPWAPPEMAPLPECSSLVLPRASCCPPHLTPTPCLSHPPHPPTEAQESVQMPPPPSPATWASPWAALRLSVSSVQWDTAWPTPRRAVLGSDGAGPVHPSTVP